LLLSLNFQTAQHSCRHDVTEKERTRRPNDGEKRLKNKMKGHREKLKGDLFYRRRKRIFNAGGDENETEKMKIREVKEQNYEVETVKRKER
jgi:hypothetical protein